MISLRQIVAGNSRMGPALLGSVLLHLVVLFVLSLQFSAWKVRRVSPSEFQDWLSVRIVAPARTEELEVPSTPPQEAATPAPEERSGTVVTRPGPGEERPAEAPKARELPPQPQQMKASGEPGAPFGVRVREQLFLRPYPTRFVEANPLLRGRDYVRASDLDVRPRALTLVIPDYPPSVLAARTRGWVTIAFFLDETGKVMHASTVEESEEFQPFEAELLAVLSRSSFTPGTVNGKAVKSITFQTIVFNPQGYVDEPVQGDVPAAGAKSN